MNPRLQALRAKRDGIVERMTEIDAAVALRSDLRLTDEETTEYESLRVAKETVNQDIDNLATEIDRDAQVAQTLIRVTPIDTPGARITHIHEREVKPMTPGEYAVACLRSWNNDIPPSEREEAQALLRVVAEVGTGDTTGILPTPIVGDLVKFVDSQRYVVNAMRGIPMPAKGKTFTRPRLTQSTQSGSQTEKSQLTSRQLTTTGDTVTKATHGTVVDISEQDIDWSEPSVFDIVYEDMAEQYAIDTEATAAAAIVAAATNTSSFDISTADSAAVAAAFAAGAGATYGRAKALPDTIFAAVNVWSFLAGLVDGDGRLVYPNLAPMNAPGQLDLTTFRGNPMGLKLVVSPAFSDNFVAIGVRRLCEVYEQNKGFISVNQPSNLEVQVAYRGYFAANVYANGLTSLQ